MDKKNHNNQNFKLQKNDIGLIEPREIGKEMESSYLDYAMSVIVSRALPDVRDGLKPVHRRVLYSMFEMGLDSKAKFRKSAAVVGETLAKYHPHGDLAVYDSLARMTQDFSMRYPLVAGQGNWGSLDGDEPAAMRYTECKMAQVAEELLTDIEKETVDFMDNYDGSKKEPQVLPAKFPNLLTNGTVGIAVGMATNIPPHNLIETCDAIIHLIKNPDSSIDDLMKYIQGPDFPTGGAIFDPEEIKNAYATGKGRIVMRAIAEIVEKKLGLKQIIISEIPFQVNKSTLVSKIADLVKSKKISGISDIRDESDKEGIRVVIDLKKDSMPEKILNQLYKFTQMQEVFHLNMLALVDGIKPQVLTLKNILEEYLKHRQKVIFQRTKFDLAKTEARIHVLEGLRKALKQINAVISTIKNSPDRESASQKLQSKFKLTQIQAENILNMRLATLAALERKKIDIEYQNLLKLAEKLRQIIKNPPKILDIIFSELEDLKKRFGDPRKTKVFHHKAAVFEQEDLIPNEKVIVTLTKGNYIKRLPITTYKSQKRGGKGVIGITTKEEDLVEHLMVANNLDDILLFSSSGKVFSVKCYDIVQATRLSRGQAVANLLKIAPEDSITGIINIADTDKDKYLLMVTEKGLVKKTPLSAFKKIRRSGMVAIRLRTDDQLQWVRPTSGKDYIIIVSQLGQAIKFSEKDIRLMGRATSGVRGIRLRPKDQVVAVGNFSFKKDLETSKFESEIKNTGLSILKKTVDEDLLVITALGFGKRTPLKKYHLQKRGGIGLRTARISEKNGPIIQAKIVKADISDLIVISRFGQVIRMPIQAIKRLGRATSGVRLIRLNPKDSVASVTIIDREPVGEEIKKQTAKKPKKLIIKKTAKKIRSQKIKPSKNKPKKSPRQIKKIIPKSSKSKNRKLKKTALKSQKAARPKFKRKTIEPNYWGTDKTLWKKRKF